MLKKSLRATFETFGSPLKKGAETKLILKVNWSVVDNIYITGLAENNE